MEVIIFVCKPILPHLYAVVVGQTSRSARVLQDPPFALGISRSKREQADVDVGRRTGVPPHNLCRCSVARKLSGIGLSGGLSARCGLSARPPRCLAKLYYRVARNRFPVKLGAQLGRALLRFEIHVVDSESLGVAVRPFEIIDQAP